MAASVEWFLPDDAAEGEEAFFEALSCADIVGTHENVASLSNDTEFCESENVYFGDADVVEATMDPLQAFEFFANLQFPRKNGLDFDGDIYRESLATRNSISRRYNTRHSTSDRGPLLPLESENERMQRIRAEIDYLDGHQAGSLPPDKDQVGLNIDSLRRALEQVSLATPCTEIPNETKSSEEGAISRKSTTGQFRQCSAPIPEERLSELDARISRLEKSLGAGAEVGSRGLWGLVRAIRTQIECASDSSLQEKAEKMDKLADLVLDQKEVAHVAAAVELLKRLDEVEPAAASLPTVALRLRSLKFAIDDASALMSSVSSLSSRHEKISRDHEENRRLLERIEKNTLVNEEAVQRNMEVLEKRLRYALQSITSDNKPAL